MEFPAIETLGPWAGMVLMGVLLVHLVKSTLPKFLSAFESMHKAHDETLTAQRKDFAETLRSDRQEQHSCLGAMTDAVKDLARRCPGGKVEGA